MHNNVANCGRKALLKQIFSVFLIFTIYFNCFSNSYASASGLGGWSITSQVSQGASTLINASKSVVINGANVVKTSTALIKPTASQVAKVLARGGAGYALSVAVEQLLGAVDWVLDPANNQIVYKDKTKPANEDPAVPVIYATNKSDYIYSSPRSAASDTCAYYDETFDSFFPDSVFDPKQTSIIFIKCRKENGYIDNWNIRLKANPIYDPAAENDDKEKTIPLETVAQQVISNAESGDTDAQAATTAAVADALANDQATQSNARQQLESNAKTATNEAAQGDTKPKDPTKPELGDELSLKFPVFCSWAPVVCEAAQIAISFPQTVTTWWDTSTKAITESWTWTKERYQAALTSISDFFKNEPNSDSDNDLPVQDIPLPELNTGTFKATAGCPAPIPINITIGTKGTGQISYEPICQFASKWSFVAPLIGFLSGAMILVGVGRKGEDGEI